MFDFFDHFDIARQIADAKAGHRITLGRAVDHERAFFDLGIERRDRHVFVVAVKVIFVDLVAQTIDVLLDDDLRKFAQVLFFQDGAGRVGRAVHDDRAGLRAEGLLDGVAVRVGTFPFGVLGREDEWEERIVRAFEGVQPVVPGGFERVVLSAFGLREGVLIERMAPEALRAHPLAAAAEALAGRAPRARARRPASA